MSDPIRQVIETWRARADQQGAIYASGIQDCLDDIEAAVAACPRAQEAPMNDEDLILIGDEVFLALAEHHEEVATPPTPPAVIPTQEEHGSHDDSDLVLRGVRQQSDTAADPERVREELSLRRASDTENDSPLVEAPAVIREAPPPEASLNQQDTTCDNDFGKVCRELWVGHPDSWCPGCLLAEIERLRAERDTFEDRYETQQAAYLLASRNRDGLEAELSALRASLSGVIAAWRERAAQHALHGDCYRKGQGWGLVDCADEIDATLKRLQGAP